VLGGLGLVVLLGCDPAPPGPSRTPDATVATAGTNHPAGTNQSFRVHGLVRAVPEGGRTLVVRHDEIPGYMPKMTMELNLRNPAEARGLAAGDEINFQLVATEETHWIEGIERLGRAVEPAEPPPAAAKSALPELKPGDELPDAGLLAEDGRMVRFTDFRGRALAFTFFFTRCPLPDFCPRMGQHFRQARELLLARPGAPTNWQFLSLSFDAEFDQPGVLTRYAQAYRGSDSDRWLYAAASPAVLSTLAPRLDFLYAREDGGFSHNLRTVVVDPRGRIHRQFDGNQWTAAELAAAVAEAAAVTGDR
jgi:protein SCO1/2